MCGNWKFSGREYIIERTFIPLFDALKHDCDGKQSKVKLNNIEVRVA
jgi:hypothetical protein